MFHSATRDRSNLTAHFQRQMVAAKAAGPTPVAPCRHCGKTACDHGKAETDVALKLAVELAPRVPGMGPMTTHAGAYRVALEDAQREPRCRVDLESLGFRAEACARSAEGEQNPTLAAAFSHLAQAARAAAAALPR